MSNIPLLDVKFAKKANLKLFFIPVTASLIVPMLGFSNTYASEAESKVEAQMQADYIEPTTDLFLQCSQLLTGAARLTCYDRVAMGKENTLGKEKQPLDLGQTLRATIAARKPQVIYSADNIAEQGEAENKVSANNTEVVEDDLLSKLGVSPHEVAKHTPLSIAFDLDKNSEYGLWSIRPHKQIYVMPVFVTFDPNRSPATPTQDAFEYTRNEYNPVELKAQISLKSKLMEDVFDSDADLWFGYTQNMHWQVYNRDNSRPFRATDYMPELFLTQPVKADLPFNGDLRMLGAGIVHHSNGREDPLSRSWNRIYLMGGAEWGNLTVIPKLWVRVKGQNEVDDNPDIEDYYGYGELRGIYNFGKGQTLGATGRFNPDTKHGAIQLDYTYPMWKDVTGFLQIFHGYGESIVDYNDETTSVGVGITLNSWKGL